MSNLLWSPSAIIERQKVARKIQQVKKKIDASETKKERTKLEETLSELRVDLNYIIVRCVCLRVFYTNLSFSITRGQRNMCPCSLLKFGKERNARIRRP